jgi:hypothetical protein
MTCAISTGPFLRTNLRSLPRSAWTGKLASQAVARDLVDIIVPNLSIGHPPLQMHSSEAPSIPGTNDGTVQDMFHSLPPAPSTCPPSTLRGPEDFTTFARTFSGKPYQLLAIITLVIRSAGHSIPLLQPPEPALRERQALRLKSQTTFYCSGACL